MGYGLIDLAKSNEPYENLGKDYSFPQVIPNHIWLQFVAMANACHCRIVNWPDGVKMLEYQDHLHQHLAPWQGLFLTLFQLSQTVTNQGLKPQSALWLQLRPRQAHCGFDRLIRQACFAACLTIIRKFY